MQLMVVDFETYWAVGHSLSNPGVTAIKYVTHPDTELISVAAKLGNAPTEVIFGEGNIRVWAATQDWANLFVVGHNMSGFDALILAWRLGVKPKMWGCTAAMARPRHAKTAHDGRVGVSLAKLAGEFGLPAKGSLEATNTKGKHLVDFTPDEIAAMREYNKLDTELCYALFKQLARETTADEMQLIDLTVRMLVEPQFELDAPLLTRTLREERVAKLTLIQDVAAMSGAYKPGMTDEEVHVSVTKTLASAAKFAHFLTELGCRVPEKVSPTTGRLIPALAKTDEGFIALQEHDDELVAAAAAARLGIRSTLLETRIESFLHAGSVCNGRLPIPLNYAGADTTQRWSGWAYNPQNLPRVNHKAVKRADALRTAIRAPKGCVIVVADLSGIEMRVNHTLWQVQASMEAFAADPGGADLYKDFAAEFYHKPRDEVTEGERQFAKMAQLGLGFGAGAGTFQNVARIMGGVSISAEEANDGVVFWRGMYRDIVRGWKRCQSVLPEIAAGARVTIDPWGLCHTAPGGIALPKGFIAYPDLRREGDEWVYGTGRVKAKIYGGKMVENLCQALARYVLADNILAIHKETGYRPALLVHDEWVGVAPESEAEELLAAVHRIMRTPPTWWPGLITWSTGGIADSYGKVK